MLITNGRVLTFGDRPRLIETGAVLIEGDLIAAVGEAAVLEAEHPATKRLDAKGMLMMPGMICAHTHFYGAFARGMYIPGPPMRDFPEILARLWWPLDRALDAEGVRYSALGPLIDAIRFGTTTLIDHHASNRFIAGSLDVIAEAVEEAGLRACLCYEVSDRDGPEVAQAGIRENVRFIEKTRRQANPRLAATFGLHAALTLSDATLADCLAAAARLGEVGFHIHAAEGTADREHSLATYGLRTLDRLAQAGILGPRTIVAHAIDIDAWEMALLRETGTWVSHQPRSNMNNAVGVADLTAWLRGGIKAVLGNDGFSNDMFTEMKTAYLLHKAARQDPRALPADQLLRLATAGNAALAGQFLPRPLGRLEPGAFADLILVDYDPPTPLTMDNLPWHLIFGFDGRDVDTTIVGGRVLMAGREIAHLDVERIAARSREVAGATWERFWQAGGSGQ
ncbi:MAG: putative aminohydrolase SsnA [Caldilineales bacterium]|nr:putative aminohydrolase SsnA [Caldilineales bacterium]